MTSSLCGFPPLMPPDSNERIFRSENRRLYSARIHKKGSHICNDMINGGRISTHLSVLIRWPKEKELQNSFKLSSS